MASKAKNTSKKQSTRKKQQRRLPCDIAGLMLIGLGIFAALSMFTTLTGVVGAAVRAFLQGMFGLFAWIMPLVLLAAGWLTLIAFKRKIGAGKVLLTVALFLFLALFLHLFWHERAAQAARDASYGAYLTTSYALGRELGLGTGLLGGAICYPVRLLIGSAGGYILSVLGMIGCIATLSHLSLTSMGQKMSQSVAESTVRAANNVRAYREEYQQRRRDDKLQRAAEREQRLEEQRRSLQEYRNAFLEDTPTKTDDAKAQTDSFRNEVLERSADQPAREAAFTPLRPRRAGEKDGLSARDDARPPLFPPELALKRASARQTLPQESTPAAAAPEADFADEYETKPAPAAPVSEENTAQALPEPEEPAIPVRPIRQVPVSVREESPEEDGPKNPSVADFDDEEDEVGGFDDEPVTITAIPKQEVEYLFGRESEPAIDPQALVEPYHFPPMDILSLPVKQKTDADREEEMQRENVLRLEETLSSFGIEARVLHVSRGPAITRYELQPARGVKVSRITGLADDIALNMAAIGVRIEAPIPGKAAVGIEIANQTIDTVPLREVLESDKFREHPSKLAVALGKDIAGDPMVADLARMPHLLIAGATGSGKSVCINSLIASILYKATPEEVKLILIDPKVVELSVYNGIPHLLIPVVTDPKKAAGALGWAVHEMDERYRAFAKSGCRDLKGYNAYLTERGEKPLPQIVVIIDELADLMMVAPGDVEERICRLAQLARAAGIHLVIATQRPSVNVITGVIKANIPSRIAFAVASQVDSRTILDMAGAEKLLGRGDMLFDPSGANKKLRVQGAFISDKEVNELVEYMRQRSEAKYDEGFLEAMEKGEEEKTETESDEEGDELLAQAVELAVDSGQISASMLQRRFRVGYARAGRLLDEMEKRKLISGFEGSKPRQVLINREEYERVFGRKSS